MNVLRSLFAGVVLALFLSTMVGASGPLGIYGIVERVVFEPNEASPERVQLWGAFAYVEGGAGGLTASAVKRGYLYFRMPDYSYSGAPSTPASRETVRREWMDLKAVAGTGQAVGFGSWEYIGNFARLDPGGKTSSPPYILERVPRGGELTDIQVRNDSDPPASPAAYQTNTGVVKIPAEGNYAALVGQLKVALKAAK